VDRVRHSPPRRRPAPDSLRWCADDTFGLHPGVDLSAAADGHYDVWAGTFGDVAADAMLHVTSSFANRP